MNKNQPPITGPAQENIKRKYVFDMDPPIPMQVIIHKSRGEVSLVEQDTIECVS